MLSCKRGVHHPVYEATTQEGSMSYRMCEGRKVRFNFWIARTKLIGQQGRIKDFWKGCSWGFALLILSHFSEISHVNEIIWSQTKLFHFHEIFKNGGRGGGFK